MFILAISTSPVLFSMQQDCGLNDFFAKLADRIYCEAECSGSSEKISQLLQDATKEFAEILDNRKPSKESTESIMHYIARTGTPGMLYRFEQTEHFNGFDNIDKETSGTPLISAALSGNIDLVKALLAKGADPSQKITRMVDGEPMILTPQIAALKLPEVISLGGFGAFATMISLAARYQNYPYDNALIQRLGNSAGILAPFHMCEQLIRAAQNLPK